LDGDAVDITGDRFVKTIMGGRETAIIPDDAPNMPISFDKERGLLKFEPKEKDGPNIYYYKWLYYFIGPDSESVIDSVLDYPEDHGFLTAFKVEAKSSSEESKGSSSSSDSNGSSSS